MLSPEQITQIKQQLKQQINSNFPENKKQEAIKKIETMGSEELEQFLIQNNLIKNDEQQGCIFCSICEGKIPTNKISENEEAIATLEIHPISKAHTIIIPKIHSEKAPKKAFELVEQIKKRIREIYKPKKIEIIPSTIFNHEILNILPIYEDETIDSKRKKIDETTLEKIQKKLTFSQEQKEPEKTLPKKQIISDKTHWLPIRIP